MAALDPRHAHLDAREGLITVGHLPIREARRAITRSLATTAQAVELFEAVAARLGEWGSVEEEPERQRLYVRDLGGWLVARPLLEIRWGPANPKRSAANAWMHDPEAVRPVDLPEGWTPDLAWAGAPDPRPQLYPRGPSMRAATVVIAEGPRAIELRYDVEGVRSGSTVTGGDPYTIARYAGVRPYAIDPLARPPTPPPIGLLCRADLDPFGHSIEELAQRIAALDPGAVHPGRARLPVSIPGGAHDAWTRARRAVAVALWEGRVPEDARFVVADGFQGATLTWGATREEALAAFEAEIERVCPVPPGFRLAVVGEQLGWPLPRPENVPAVLLPLPPVPPGLLRVVDEHGEIGHVLRRGDTLIGEHVLDLVDDGLRAELDAVEAAVRDELGAAWSDPDSPVRTLTFTLWDDERRARVPARLDAAAWTAEAGPCGNPWRVVRRSVG